jgi:hypothetical protein
VEAPGFPARPCLANTNQLTAYHHVRSLVSMIYVLATNPFALLPIHLFFVCNLFCGILASQDINKKELQTLRQNGSHMTEQTCPSHHLSRNHYLLRYGRYSFDLLQEVLSAEFPLAFNNFFSSSSNRGAVCHRFLVSLESLDKHSIRLAVAPIIQWY